MSDAARPMLALIRGINVGGRATLSMGELRLALSDAGFTDVRTHLQSGNVLITPPSDPNSLARMLEATIEKGFGLKVRVITRTREDLKDIIARNPLLEPGMKPSTVHAVFLESAPGREKVAALDPGRSPPDRFVVSGKEIFVRYPQGSGRSKLSLDYFERNLGVAGTARNWNTVTKLSELLEI